MGLDDKLHERRNIRFSGLFNWLAEMLQSVWKKKVARKLNYFAEQIKFSQEACLEKRKEVKVFLQNTSNFCQEALK